MKIILKGEEPTLTKALLYILNPIEDDTVIFRTDGGEKRVVDPLELDMELDGYNYEEDVMLLLHDPTGFKFALANTPVLEDPSPFIPVLEDLLDIPGSYDVYPKGAKEGEAPKKFTYIYPEVK